MDFTAAYLNADMPLDKDGDPVIMVLEPHVAEIAIMVEPSWKRLLTKSGKLECRSRIGEDATGPSAPRDPHAPGMDCDGGALQRR